MQNSKPFELIDLLISDEAIQEYLSQVMSDGDRARNERATPTGTAQVSKPA